MQDKGEQGSSGNMKLADAAAAQCSAEDPWVLVPAGSDLDRVAEQFPWRGRARPVGGLMSSGGNCVEGLCRVASTL